MTMKRCADTFVSSRRFFFLRSCNLIITLLVLFDELNNHPALSWLLNQRTARASKKLHHQTIKNVQFSFLNSCSHAKGLKIFSLQKELQEDESEGESLSGPFSLSERMNTQTTSSMSSSDMMAVASMVTKDSCRLLGVKSIGVDFGLVRTGVAATVGYEPTPLAILTMSYNLSWSDEEQERHRNEQQNQLCERVVNIANTQQASRIIVGLPLNKNGTLSTQTNRTLNFGQQLARMVLTELGPSVSVVWWDERYTSKLAATRARVKAGSCGSGYSSQQQLYGTLDADSACILLEHYYEENGQGAEPIEIGDESIRAELIEQFASKKEREAASRMAFIEEREEKIRRRKEVMLRAQQQQQMEVSAEGSAKSKKKKRKKKK